MTRLGNYLTDPTIQPHTETCRVKAWAHDNAFTLIYLSAVNVVGWVVTVIQCH